MVWRRCLGRGLRFPNLKALGLLALLVSTNDDCMRRVGVTYECMHSRRSRGMTGAGKVEGAGVRDKCSFSLRKS